MTRARRVPTLVMAALVLAASAARADEGAPVRLLAGEDAPGGPLATRADAPYRLMNARLDGVAPALIAQATGAPAASAGGAAAEPSASELNKQLSNPVTSLWSLTFQFNNYRLENGQWNNNLQFQPVLPIASRGTSTSSRVR